jgi:hypothetical protein
MLDRLAGVGPAEDSVFHHRDVRVTGIDRPPGGVVRGHSMQVCAIKDQRRALVGG